MPDKPFSFNTITDFDNHILQSIPNYDILFSSIVRLSDYFKDEKKVIYDVGASTGNLLKYFKRVNHYNGKMVGLDISRNLLPENTREYDNITFLEHDLSKPYSFNNACLVFSIFTLQFLPKDARKGLLRSIYEGLNEGGALIIAEKTYLENGMFQDMFTSTYYDYKAQSFTEKEIFDKERVLRTILKPNTEKENLAMLREVGFQKIEKFYSYFQFQAFVCVK
jgi:tRNA (cmo5U34)-methyltransferase